MPLVINESNWVDADAAMSLALAKCRPSKRRDDDATVDVDT